MLNTKQGKAIVAGQAAKRRRVADRADQMIASDSESEDEDHDGSDLSTVGTVVSTGLGSSGDVVSTGLGSSGDAGSGASVEPPFRENTLVNREPMAQQSAIVANTTPPGSYYS